MNSWNKQLIKAHKNHVYEHVFINKQGLDEFIKKLKKTEIKIPNWRFATYPADDEDFMQFVPLATAINAYYRDAKTKKKFTIHWNRDFITGEKIDKAIPYKGANGMCASIMRAILDKDWPLLDANFLAHEFTLEMVKEMFTGEDNDPPMPLIKPRWSILTQLGEILLRYYDGKFKNLFEAADYQVFKRGRGIASLLNKHFPFAFDDYRFINGQFLPFYKKNLLVSYIYAGRALDSDMLAPIKDIDNLSAVCDYQLPRVLRFNNAISYSLILEKMIERQEIIMAGSDEETEIRLITAVVVDIIGKKTKLSPLQVDFLLWKSGRDCANKHHITPTMDY